MNGSAVDIGTFQLVFGYFLLIIPLAVLLYYKIRLLKALTAAVIRMTVQLLFVGFYLQVVFRFNQWWLNIIWLLIMLFAADVSVLTSSRLKIRRFVIPVAVSLLVGTGIPLLYFIAVILRLDNLIEAQYFIPIAGMILGNSLRANIVGMSDFYHSIRSREKAFQFSLSLGAGRYEAILPYLRKAYAAALSPTVATIATVGLVSLPGMMTGIILGGTNPMVAIKYQMAIMIAIFTGTVLSVIIGILMTIPKGFDSFGTLDREVFRE